jgi:uncharacterized membrane-anchored protein
MKIERKILWVFFTVAVILQLGLVVRMIAHSETTLNHGTTVKFGCIPVDPYDAFRGRYLDLALRTFEMSPEGLLPAEIVSLPVDERKGKTLYALIAVDDDGFGRVQRYLSRPPEDRDALWLKVRLADDGYMIDYPLRKYFINEKIADRAEKAFGEALLRDPADGEMPDPWVTVSLFRGRGVIRTLFIDGLPLEEYLKAEEGKDRQRQQETGRLGRSRTYRRSNS